MIVTFLPAEKPDVEVRLTAEEASALKKFAGNILVGDIADVMGVDEDVEHPVVTALDKLFTDVYVLLSQY